MSYLRVGEYQNNYFQSIERTRGNVVQQYFAKRNETKRNGTYTCYTEDTKMVHTQHSSRLNPRWRLVIHPALRKHFTNLQLSVEFQVLQIRCDEALCCNRFAKYRFAKYRFAKYHFAKYHFEKYRFAKYHFLSFRFVSQSTVSLFRK